VTSRAKQDRRREDCPDDAELTHQLEAVEAGPVLDDPAVTQPAQRDAPQVHPPTAVRSGQVPAARDAVILLDLLDTSNLRSSNRAR
jgi:hypothetical protein